MHYTLEILPDYLKAEMIGRETPQETREFLRAAATKALEHGCTRALICVRASRPIFKVDQYNISFYLKELGARPDVKVALVASENDVHASHEYVEVLARQHGANLQCFRDESAAIEWLKKPQ